MHHKSAVLGDRDRNADSIRTPGFSDTVGLKLHHTSAVFGDRDRVVNSESRFSGLIAIFPINPDTTRLLLHHMSTAVLEIEIDLSIRNRDFPDFFPTQLDCSCPTCRQFVGNRDNGADS